MLRLFCVRRTFTPILSKAARPQTYVRISSPTEIEGGVHEINIKTRQEHVQTFVEILKTAGCREDSIESYAGDPDGAHASSTCRMSSSDVDGVVDPDLQVHGTDNLYVCSNAVFPSIAAANPTLTVSALAVRLAEHIGEQSPLVPLSGSH